MPLQQKHPQRLRRPGSAPRPLASLGALSPRPAGWVKRDQGFRWQGPVESDGPPEPRQDFDLRTPQQHPVYRQHPPSSWKTRRRCTLIILQTCRSCSDLVIHHHPHTQFLATVDRILANSPLELTISENLPGRYLLCRENSITMSGSCPEEIAGAARAWELAHPMRPGLCPPQRAQGNLRTVPSYDPQNDAICVTWS